MHPLLLSLCVALGSTLLLLPVGVPLAYWLAFGRSPWRRVVDTLVCMPLVLPPTVLGFYLLVVLRPQGMIGSAYASLTGGGSLVFSVQGLVVGACLFSMPFLVQPLKAGFLALPPSLREASASLGKSHPATFFRILLPNARNALLAGAILATAHTMGEFGVAMMLGGNIPGKTQVASVALYSRVEALDFTGAHAYAALLAGSSLALMAALGALGARPSPTRCLATPNTSRTCAG